MTETNAKIHVLADETLGGIKREYVEVDRKLEMGDTVLVMKMDGKDTHQIATIADDDYGGDFSYVTVQLDRSINGEDLVDMSHRSEDEIVLIEPTDIVHIGTQRYELTDRKAEVGEKVVVVDDEDSSEEFGSFRIGEVGTVESYSSDDMHYGIYANVRVSDERDIPLYSPEYRVLVPVEAESDEPQPSDPIFAIGNVAQEVAKLKRTVVRLVNEIDTLHKDNLTLGEELARLKESATGVKGEKLFTADELAAIIERLLMRP
ncbi:hypothetical protein FVD41_11155 [Bacillus amyloliquefaciens]|nr:hypothetical protein [Bacillus amyloliquefaciens]TXK24531.1 hypothetical protein FVD42_11220 [Bacillus amyloliquefaciens]TXK30746.1 hypothetical protein FVD41_11155 [Bacillus amyloliquefaciens]